MSILVVCVSGYDPSRKSVMGRAKSSTDLARLTTFNERQKMGFYTKKPVTIEALQWDGNNTDEVIEWGKGQISFSYGRPATVHSLSCRCDGRGMIPSDGPISSVVTCPETRPTGAIPSVLLISTLEGEMTAEVGAWIIKGVQGEFYPCKPDIFEATYEPPRNLTAQEIDYADLACNLDTYSSGTVHMDGSVDSVWPKYFNSPGNIIVNIPAPVLNHIRLAADIIASLPSPIMDEE